ncbi:unnamed protein product [Adineta ricciae]|uniref:Uncharacterized protein n=1 Tax=Adineta ricciae TaxID=249248 RepID=A0A814NGR0_ADIRI|nr:unnamed protein product [Adineta ricciae]CAF1091217.1 unnamed protein product [Adineta ricciae]
MARRADWDVDDFEILPNPSRINIPQTFEIISDDGFEIVTNENKSTDRHSTTSGIEQPIESFNEVKPQSSPYVRYGSAASIPCINSFDYKSILTSKSIAPSNNIMDFIRADQSTKCSFINNDLNDVLSDYTRDRENLVRLAKQRQDEFIKAMRLD